MSASSKNSMRVNGVCGHCSKTECPCVSPEVYTFTQKSRCKIGEVRYHPGILFHLFCDGSESKLRWASDLKD